MKKMVSHDGKTKLVSFGGSPPAKRQQKIDTEDEVMVHSLLGKRRRCKRPSDFETYKHQTMVKIEELEA